MASPLILLSAPAYEGSRARAALDVLMSFAVFAQEPQVLITGAAVDALVARSEDAQCDQPSLRKIIESLPLYDVERIWVDRHSLAAAAIGEDALPAFATVADDEDMRRLIAKAGHVLSL
jgi:tRNA 2-thiouridine synthesizing protein C